MSPDIKSHIGKIFIALAPALAEIGQELMNSRTLSITAPTPSKPFNKFQADPPPEDTATTPKPDGVTAIKPRGRPKKEQVATDPQPEVTEPAPAQPGQAETPVSQPSGEVEAQPEKQEQSDADRWEANKQRILPLAQAGHGLAIKNIVAKYSATGMKDIPADKQAAFEKDLEALTF